MACLRLSAQSEGSAYDSTVVPKKKSTYDKKEEILFDNNRYRKYNNYLTFGGGGLGSTIQQNVQKAFGADYHFHIRRQYLQAGILFSGEDISASNDIQIHFCYGIREEKNRTNVSLFAGPSFFTGVDGTPGVTGPTIYSGVGAYFCFQAIFKIKYDLGIGFDVFADLADKREMGGIKLILFFSGAYRGVKQNFNPHVKAEKR